jgi:uncharacterized protein (TIGR00299 family) protein
MSGRPATAGRHAWIDASAGVAGDMLLGALHDAGADLANVQAAVDAVVPGAVAISATTVSRAGQRAVKVRVEPLVSDPGHRTWAQIKVLLDAAELPFRVRSRAAAVFARLAQAEATVHGIAADDVHFHEVGALDSIADVVGVCAALEGLGVDTVSAGEIALGTGRTRTAHGELPVPVPAVAELARGWRVRGGGRGELATPTGLALVRTLARACEDLPAMTIAAIGVGAGTRDVPDRPNVVRILLGAAQAPAIEAPATEAAVLIEANVDDLDPRLWPGVLTALLEAGASDAWLVPILMKKGRPAHTLTVLCAPQRVPALRAVIFGHTSTLGLRESARGKSVLDRFLVDVEVFGETVAIKVGHSNGVIVQAMPEFEEVAAVARRQRRPEREVLAAALHVAAEAGLSPGADLSECGLREPSRRSC